DEKQGLELFVKYGCVSCHQGRNIGGEKYYRIRGGVGQLLARTDGHKDGKKSDPHGARHLRPRVPQPRQLAVAASEPATGTEQTLDETIAVMGRHQIGRKLENDEVRYLKAFLLTLTGQYPDGTPVCKED